MSDYLIDVTKVHSANAAALETALDTQMWGMEETNYTIGAKDSGDTMRWFWPRINDNIALVDQWVSNDGGDEGLSVDDDGKVQMTSHLGIGVAASSPLTIRNTSSQVRIEYDGTYYSTIAVSSTGTTTVTAVTGGVQLVATTGRIFLQAGNGDVVASLSDNAGSHKISIIDSDTTEVTSIDSAGNIACSGTITPGGNIILGSNYLSGDGGNEGISIDASGNVGIGVAAPTAKLEILGTSTQLKLSYNASKYATFSVDSSSTFDIASEATKIFSAYTTKAVINDGGADVDFIVKSDDNTELIKCDAGTNLTTIGDGLSVINKAQIGGLSNQLILTDGYHTGTFSVDSGEMTLSHGTKITLNDAVKVTGSIQVYGDIYTTQYTSWSPTITRINAGGTTPEYANIFANYYKLGNMVFFWMTISGDGGADGSGSDLLLVSLPVTSGGTMPNYTDDSGYNMSVAAHGFYQNGSSVQSVFATLHSTSQLWLQKASNGAFLACSDQDNASRTISISGSYRTD